MEAIFVLASLTIFCESFWDLIESFNWKKILITVVGAIGIYIEDKYL